MLHGLSKGGVASLDHGEFRMVSLCDEWLEWVWNCFIGYVYDLECVACPQLVWHVFRVCGMSCACGWSSIGVVLPQWVWHCLNGCGMASVGVGKVSIGVAWS